ncbi:MAG: DUF934 domain-containing protein, partial [Gammaproteobacteria bacterium]|nr:DUF934 domain-containing protein [Gammaproteobacteria bacterium]
MVANRAIKARAKATPDRIQENIANAKVIKGGAVHDNQMIHIAEAETLSVADLPQGSMSVPLSLWLASKLELQQRPEPVAVQIAVDEFPEQLADDLSEIDCVVLPTVNFVDGRAYSHAYKLRTQFNFKGEIRAVGDVHFDHLNFLARCGCDAFELPDGDDHQA